VAGLADGAGVADGDGEAAGPLGTAAVDVQAIASRPRRKTVVAVRGLVMAG